jgi:quercetin dioxygenase-like cupin family protein
MAITKSAISHAEHGIGEVGVGQHRAGFGQFALQIPQASQQRHGSCRTCARRRLSANCHQKSNAEDAMSQQTQDHGPEYRHIDEMEWETLRFPGQHSKMVFHPRPERPSEPNTGFVRYLPGSFHPRHRHDFAQVWYILEGTFKIGERTVGPGTVVFHADPHYEEDLSTETGGLMFFVQYTGPSTGKGPIYDGRFNMQERKPLSEENLQV